jgi:ABC-2 type transport system permease protein
MYSISISSYLARGSAKNLDIKLLAPRAWTRDDLSSHTSPAGTGCGGRLIEGLGLSAAVVLLIGTHQMIAQLFQAFFFVNVANIPELVRTGKLDSLLVLPIDSQFAVSTKQFSLDSIVNAGLGGVVVCVALSRLNVVPDLTSIVLYLVALGFGIAVHYSIMLALAAVSFWIVRAQGLVYGYFNFLNIARYPDAIFPWLFRLIFGWIIPVVIIANIPARLLIKSLGQPWWLMLHLVTASTIVFLLSRGFWKFALNRYSSASS